MSTLILAMRQPSDVRPLVRVLLAAGMLGLTGCAVGPDFRPPAPPAAQGYAPQAMPSQTAAAADPLGAAQHFDPQRDIPADWWTVFHSARLDALIRRAMQANPGIASAQAALKQAQEYVYAQQGYFYPTVGLSYSPSRQQLAGNMGGNSPGIQGNGTIIQTYQNPAGPAPYNGPVIYTFHTAQLTVGYTPDVFGANRRQVESLQAQADMQRYQLEAARVTLASNIVAAALQEAALRAQLDAVKAMIADSQRALGILQRQLASGYAMRIDVAAQESALAVAQQQLPPLERQLQQTRDLLRVLAGNTPDQDVERFSMDDFRLPQQLPESLPSQLVRQRPDVLAAEEQMHAASANVGVAVAARLPQFSIVGAVGGEASVFNQMFQSGGPFWALVGNITQPVFDGNTLLHRERAADQALVQAAAQYRQTVLTALQNVADTLHALHADADGMAAAVRAEQAARVTLDLTRKQNIAGYVNLLVLLSAEQNWLQAHIALIQARSQRLGDTAALYQALGGGWWNTLPAKDQPAGASPHAGGQS